MSYWSGEWRPYVPVAKRRAQAAKEIAKLAKKGGRTASPVRIEGRKIAQTVWGQGWCENLERYSDYENRLPRGRTYVRNGSVVDLEITAGEVRALVSGSSLYKVRVSIRTIDPARWNDLVNECSGKVGSLVELLKGRLARGVMDVLARPGTGLFPEPGEISLDCSCPDWAEMCKHVAATLYGVGARLDERPELLFTLRKVDHLDLLAHATPGALGGKVAAGKKLGDGADLTRLFGIELDEAKDDRTTPAPAPRKGARAVPAKPTRIQASRAPSPPPPRRRAKAAARPPTITVRQLVEAGIPRTTFQNWVTAGALIRTDERGVYLRTAGGDARIEAFARRALGA